MTLFESAEKVPLGFNELNHYISNVHKHFSLYVIEILYLYQGYENMKSLNIIYTLLCSETKQFIYK